MHRQMEGFWGWYCTDIRTLAFSDEGTAAGVEGRLFWGERQLREHGMDCASAGEHVQQQEKAGCGIQASNTSRCMVNDHQVLALVHGRMLL